MATLLKHGDDLFITPYIRDPFFCFEPIFKKTCQLQIEIRWRKNAVSSVKNIFQFPVYLQLSVTGGFGRMAVDWTWTFKHAIFRVPKVTLNTATLGFIEK